VRREHRPGLTPLSLFAACPAEGHRKPHLPQRNITLITAAEPVCKPDAACWKSRKRALHSSRPPFLP
jgi:hypothetical protein